MYKFGGQPYVNSFIMNNYSSGFKSMFGEKHFKTMIYAVAGSIMGVGEILLLPLGTIVEHIRQHHLVFRFVLLFNRRFQCFQMS